MRLGIALIVIGVLGRHSIIFFKARNKIFYNSEYFSCINRWCYRNN